MLMQSQFIFGHQTRIVSRSKNGTIIAASTLKLRNQSNHHQTFAVTRPKSNNIPSSSRRRRRSSSSSSSSWVTSTIVVASSSTGLFDCPIFAEKALDKFQQSTSSTTKATTEEARVLFENNYIILDCRALDEIDFEGRCSGKPNVIEVPLINAKRVYDADAGKKVYKQEKVNAEAFLSSVTAKAGATKDAKIMIMDSIGGVRAERAFEILSSNGFSSLVLVDGGVNAWKAAWDATMRRRQLPGSFSRGFDNAMFSDSMVSHAETFGSGGDETAWVYEQQYQEKEADGRASTKSAETPNSREISNLKVENRVVSGASMDDKFSERRFIKLENVTNDVISSLSNVFAGSSSIFSSSRGDANLETKKWGTVAVSLEKSRPFTTANGKHFSTISFGNLDKSELSVKLFGEAHQAHWKEAKAGMLYALLDCKPYLCPKTKKFSVSIEDPSQMIKIGKSPDFAYCKGTRAKDGLPCTKAVNLSKCEFCEFHAGGALRALQTERVALASGASKNNSAINQLGGQFAARSNASRSSHFVNPGGGIGNVAKPSDNMNTTSTLNSMHNQRAGNQILSKLAQKQQQMGTMGVSQRNAASLTIGKNDNTSVHKIQKKMSKNEDKDDDDDDSDDEELLVEEAPRDAALDARVAKVAEAQKRAKALLGNQELKASDPNNTKVQSFKNRLLNVDLFAGKGVGFGKENMTTSKSGSTNLESAAYVSRLEGENSRLVRELKETRDELARAKAELVRLGSTFSTGRATNTNNKNNNTVRNDSRKKVSTSSFSDAFKNIVTKEDISRPSLHAKEAADEATDTVFNKMDDLEKMDQIRTFLEDVREQDVDAYYCKQCNKWTSFYPKQSCGDEGAKHPIEKKKATARWFTCSSCATHITTLNQIMPLKCTKHGCNGGTFARTGKPVQSEKRILGSDRLEDIADRKLMKPRGIEHGFSLRT
ncbi:unnamed protein product [Bathycoccus prasinos]